MSKSGALRHGSPGVMWGLRQCSSWSRGGSSARCSSIEHAVASFLVRRRGGGGHVARSARRETALLTHFLEAVTDQPQADPQLARAGTCCSFTSSAGAVYAASGVRAPVPGPDSPVGALAPARVTRRSPKKSCSHELPKCAVFAS